MIWLRYVLVFIAISCTSTNASPLIIALFIVYVFQAIDNVYNISVKARANQIRDRVKRDDIYKKRTESRRKDASLSILARVSKRWATSGQQKVETRALVIEAMKTEYSNT